MKYPMLAQIVLCFLLFSQTLSAQEKRRPSWSEGLPEKTQAPNRNIPKITTPEVPKEDRDSATSDSDNELEIPWPIEPPKSGLVLKNDSIELPGSAAQDSPRNTAAPTNEPLVNPVSAPVSAPTIELKDVQAEASLDANSAVVEESADKASITANKLPIATQNKAAERIISQSSSVADKTYSWQITRQQPVKVSPALFSQFNSVLLKLMINSNGEVVGVDRVLASTPETLVSQSQRALKRWRFAAPRQEGIDEELLERVFKIPLTAR